MPVLVFFFKVWRAVIKMPQVWTPGVGLRAKADFAGDDRGAKILKGVIEKRGFVPDFHKILIEEDLDFYRVYEKMTSHVYTREKGLILI
jgi:hypothetical protein